MVEGAVAEGEPGGLVITKFHLPPSPPAGLVTRSRLSDRLAGRPARSVVLVCAPAGFGKTAMLADWCRQQSRPVAWLSLDANDNDPTRFWRHCAAAVERIRPGITDVLTPFIDASLFEEAVTSLVNEFAAEPDVGVLVLDDYHLIDAQPVHASVRALLEFRPPGLTVALASRSEPPLPLARLRASGELTEIRAADLRFTDTEAGSLLDLTVGTDLDMGEIAALVARTEGWAAGLQMAGLSLRDRTDVNAFIASFSGSHRHVLDYLTEEVLDRQKPALRTFLLETSVLARLSGRLCDAMTGRSDSQQMLEAIEQDSLFLTPLDDVRGWWRYHQLFADLLQRRLLQERPQDVAALHRHAGLWHAEHGHAEDAIRHAFSASDPGWAAELLERHADELLVRRQDLTVHRLVAALPVELLGTKPRILMGQARLALFGGQLGEVEDLLDSAEKAHANAGGDQVALAMTGHAGEPPLDVAAAVVSLRAWRELLRGYPEDARRFATQTLREFGEQGGPNAAAAYAHLAGADQLAGRFAEAEHGFARSLAGWRKAGDRDMGAWMNVYLGQLRRDRGALDGTLDACRQAVELATVPEGPPLPALGPAHVGIAQVAYERNDLDTAWEEIEIAVSLCRRFTYARSLAAALAAQAQVLQATGDTEGARRTMDEAATLTDPDVVDVYNPVLALRARLALAQGDPATANDWTRERGLHPDGELGYPQEPAYLVLSRVLRVEGRPARALGLLDRLHRRAVDQDRIRSRIEIQVERALALDATGAATEALAALDDALTMAQPQEHIRVFVDEGTAMATLLGRFIATQDAKTTAVDLSYLGRLLQAFEPIDDDTGARSASSVVGLVTQLTEREIEVLRLLAAGQRNDQIAAELYVALSTVKTHVTHIFDKLGASNRTEATARARDLGLGLLD